MKIAVDAGGRLSLEETVRGAAQAARDGAEILLFGPAEDLRRALLACSVPERDARVRVVDAPEAIGLEEDPAAACRDKARSSLLLAAGAVSRGEAEALLSSGNLAAVVLAASWNVKRLPGVLKPPLACRLGTSRGRALLLDAGVHADCKPWHLLQFGLLGAAYARRVLRISSPKVGLLSTGEAGTLNETVREALPLLKYSGLEFAGAVDGRDVALGKADVVVCDGYAGSVCRKTLQGTAAAFAQSLEEALAGGRLAKLGAALLRPALEGLRGRWTSGEGFCSTLLGLEAPVVHCRGRGAEEIAAAARLAAEIAASGMNEDVRGSIQDFKTSMDAARPL
ncbi:MAG TPA: phosphate--acyl-ACP acyltransferase [Elusimicrobia bacterium]|nr:phosphate--acyl-ACP acyltransferase [Elusimicrobiota bacterium]